MFQRLPPYSGIMLSTSVTCAPSSTRRIASVEPINPSPPVISAREPRNPSCGIGCLSEHIRRIELVPSLLPVVLHTRLVLQSDLGTELKQFALVEAQLERLDAISEFLKIRRGSGAIHRGPV